MRRFMFVLVLLFSLTGFTQNGYTIIYEADKEGNKIQGNLDELVKHVQNGNPIRVGWVLKFIHPETKETIEMQHWTDAGFITTLYGHVFAQLRGIFEQGPSITKPPGVFLATNKPNTWVAIIGTTGTMRQKYDSSQMVTALKESGLNDQEIQQYLKDQETRKVHTKWAVMNN